MGAVIGGPGARVSMLGASVAFWNPGDTYNPNTLCVVTNGVVVASLDLDSALEASDYFSVFMNYTAATKQLSITFDSDAKAPVSGSWTIDMGAVFGDAAVTPGFDAWTGAAYETHDVVSASVIGVSPAPAIATFGTSRPSGANNFIFEGGNFESPLWSLRGWVPWPRSGTPERRERP